MRVELGPDGPCLRLDRPDPPAGEHRVLIRVELAGLCRSDLKEVARERHGPSQFGHELVGLIAESTLADRLPTGLRVALDPNVRLARTTGFATEMYAAGPADRLLTALPRIPDRISARQAVFAEPLACAGHCVAALAGHLGVPPAGRRVVVFGAGAAGLLIARLAELAGADVTLANRSADRAKFLQDRGFEVRAIATLPASAFDAAVIATSFVRPDILAEALHVLVPAGLALLYGGTAPGDELPGLPVDLDRVRRHEHAVHTTWFGRPVTVAGSYGTTPADFAAALITLPNLPLERLITEEITLPELPAVLRDQITGRPLGKTVIRP
ncbi:alcohol dehydrogenase catalytic domain-containing protein [Embleya scabrispora]|uniref:alcohol dehydrogenase catalytic domain-containing protein n=1 Tax=Embleya scabrispora TaxID=159449 RepID=UPI00039B8858|nr:alcohol dehydrogenase catalytic domain-containing protein [Embleya scabrispora]MYS83220.1 alcohol dehydrogenase catalytic domain-containing protein [Streptomyces sp. SID5474]